MGKYQLTPQDLVGSKYQTKSNISKAAIEATKTSMEQECQGKSKMTYFLEGKQCWKPGVRAKYMNELTRKQTSTIFKARSRMLKVKCNYKNGYKDLKCRICKNEEETQTHILEHCPAIHTTGTLKVSKHQLFNQDTGALRKIADNIIKIMEKVDENVQ